MNTGPTDGPRKDARGAHPGQCSSHDKDAGGWSYSTDGGSNLEQKQIGEKDGPDVEEGVDLSP
jgi:hypothetical protein